MFKVCLGWLPRSDGANLQLVFRIHLDNWKSWYSITLKKENLFSWKGIDLVKIYESNVRQVLKGMG